MLIELWYWRFSNYRYFNYLMMKILSSSIFPYIYNYIYKSSLFLYNIHGSWSVSMVFPPVFEQKQTPIVPGTHGSPPAAFQPPLRSRWRSLSTGRRSPWRRAPSGSGGVFWADEETSREEKKDGSSGKKCGKHVESIRNLRETWWTMWIMVDIPPEKWLRGQKQLDIIGKVTGIETQIMSWLRKMWTLMSRNGEFTQQNMENVNPQKLMSLPALG